MGRLRIWLVLHSVYLKQGCGCRYYLGNHHGSDELELLANAKPGYSSTKLRIFFPLKRAEKGQAVVDALGSCPGLLWLFGEHVTMIRCLNMVQMGSRLRIKKAEDLWY